MYHDVQILLLTLNKLHPTILITMPRSDQSSFPSDNLSKPATYADLTDSCHQVILHHRDLEGLEPLVEKKYSEAGGKDYEAGNDVWEQIRETFGDDYEKLEQRYQTSCDQLEESLKRATDCIGRMSSFALPVPLGIHIAYAISFYETPPVVASVRSNIQSRRLEIFLLETRLTSESLEDREERDNFESELVHLNWRQDLDDRLCNALKVASTSQHQPKLAANRELLTRSDLQAQQTSMNSHANRRSPSELLEDGPGELFEEEALLQIAELRTALSQMSRSKSPKDRWSALSEGVTTSLKKLSNDFLSQLPTSAAQATSHLWLERKNYATGLGKQPATLAQYKKADSDLKHLAWVTVNEHATLLSMTLDMPFEWRMIPDDELTCMIGSQAAHQSTTYEETVQAQKVYHALVWLQTHLAKPPVGVKVT